jgi:hypothetical protein
MCPALLTGSSRLVNWKRPDLKLRKDLDVPDVEEERTLMCKALLTGSLPPATWNRPRKDVPDADDVQRLHLTLRIDFDEPDWQRPDLSLCTDFDVPGY